MSDKVPGIYAKLHAVMSEANFIQRDGENKFHNYKYATEAAIKSCIHGLFVKHKVLPQFSTCNQQSSEIRTKKGDVEYRTLLDLSYRFTDIEDGSFVEGTMCGAGAGEADKSTYKAVTGALKYCLTSQFIIPTGDDPENDGQGKAQPKSAHKERVSTTIGDPARDPVMEFGGINGRADIKYITEPQRKRLYAIQGKANWTDEQAKTLLADNGITSSKLIPAGAVYDKVCATIENMRFEDYLDSKNNPVA